LPACKPASLISSLSLQHFYLISRYAPILPIFYLCLWKNLSNGSSLCFDMPDVFDFAGYAPVLLLASVFIM
jgi:hypothetical protein